MRDLFKFREHDKDTNHHHHSHEKPNTNERADASTEKGGTAKANSHHANCAETGSIKDPEHPTDDHTDNPDRALHPSPDADTHMHTHTHTLTHAHTYTQAQAHGRETDPHADISNSNTTTSLTKGGSARARYAQAGECAQCDAECESDALLSNGEDDDDGDDYSEDSLLGEAFVSIEYMYLDIGEAQKYKSYPQWVGKDYSNPCVRDFFDLHKPYDDSVDRWAQSRMPWHDVGLGMYGQCARDVGRHFIDRWNHVKVVKAKKDSSIPFLVPKRDMGDAENMDIRNRIPTAMGVPSHHIQPSDKETKRAGRPETGTGDLSIAGEPSQNATDGKNATDSQNATDGQNVTDSQNAADSRKSRKPKTVIKRSSEEILAGLGMGDEFFRTTNQILRSCCEWSNGISTEHSIQNAYLQAIAHAKHYIYIENQFFVTALPADGVTNKIGDALFEKIVECHRANKKFRVYVIMPLMPAFEGDFGPNATSLQVVMHWQYKSINRGPESLLQRLSREIGDWKPYISFACLRQHSNLMGEPVENQIYVHSKLLIADDNTVICGSANINDRSMLGSRDSEIAVMIQDEDFEDGMLDGLPVQCGRYAKSLRKRIFAEHLGLTEDEAGKDVVADDFFDGVWTARALANTEIYERVFRTVPNNHVHCWEDLEDWKAEVTVADSDPDKAFQELLSIRGHIVDMPFDFLKEENLGPSRSTREGWVPMKTFT